GRDVAAGYGGAAQRPARGRRRGPVRGGTPGEGPVGTVGAAGGTVERRGVRRERRFPRRRGLLGRRGRHGVGGRVDRVAPEPGGPRPHGGARGRVHRGGRRVHGDQAEEAP